MFWSYLLAPCKLSPSDSGGLHSPHGFWKQMKDMWFSMSVKPVLKFQFYHQIWVQLWSSYIIPLKCRCLICRQRYLPGGAILRTRNCMCKGLSAWHIVGVPELLLLGTGKLDLNLVRTFVFTVVCDRLLVKLSQSNCQSLEWKWEKKTSCLLFLEISSQDVLLLFRKNNAWPFFVF